VVVKAPAGDFAMVPDADKNEHGIRARVNDHEHQYRAAGRHLRNTPYSE